MIESYIQSNFKDFENLHILEVGCGNGGITFPLASLVCHIRTFDINEDKVKYVQNQINQKKIKILIVTVDDGNSFDDGYIYEVVIVSEVFEHILKPSKFLSNIIRRMREGSYLILTVPNGFGPWELRNHVFLLNYLVKWN